MCWMGDTVSGRYALEDPDGVSDAVGAALVACGPDASLSRKLLTARSTRVRGAATGVPDYASKPVHRH